MTLDGSDTSPRRPLLRVVRGEPTAEELAALIAVISSRGSTEPDQAPIRSQWRRPVMRQPLSPGPGAWRASSLPR